MSTFTLFSGGGGGWNPGNLTTSSSTGLALLLGGVGGKPCYQATDYSKGTGGFGGGGGGCVAGGGGGGYTGIIRILLSTS